VLKLLTRVYPHARVSLTTHRKLLIIPCPAFKRAVGPINHRPGSVAFIRLHLCSKVLIAAMHPRRRCGAERWVKAASLSLSPVTCNDHSLRDKTKRIYLCQGCHADDNGRTDGRMMAVGSFVTWTHCSVRAEVTWGKTLASTRTRVCPRPRTSPLPYGRSLLSVRMLGKK
jgi:hypothetical protein